MCDCDGKRRTLRVIEVGGGDPSTQMLEGIEAATGNREVACPWRAFRDPFVSEVLSAYRHWKQRQLALVWGPDPPAALMQGLEVYDAALNGVQLHDARKERERRERERERAKLDTQVGKHRGRRAR